jgi:CubicO group peptidase (beta-lactamase class C family)
VHAVDGHAARGFGPVKDVFSAGLDSGLDLGAGFCAHVDGEAVVDLWGGRRRPESDEPYGADALQMVFSATKGITALCVHMAVERGVLDLDAPVARWWPEFAQAGKEDIPVRWLLSHRAGLPTFDRRLSPEEVAAWNPVCDALAAQRPYWEPGTAYGYHALTFGWLVGELFRRAEGRTVGRFLAEEIVARLGLEMWIGLPEHLSHRVVPLSFASTGAMPADPGSLLARTASLNGALGSLADWVNEPAGFGREMPAGNAITNARSLSRLYAAIVGPVAGGPPAALLSPAQLEVARTPQTAGPDAVFASGGLPVEIKIGVGFWVHSPVFPFGASGSFGHPGTSGAVGFVDPEHKIACGYVTNKMADGLQPDVRPRRLVSALYEAMGLDQRR